jgi:hypothetical protein
VREASLADLIGDALEILLDLLELLELHGSVVPNVRW